MELQILTYCCCLLPILFALAFGDLVSRIVLSTNSITLGWT
jgi:hypothetical protein